MSRPLRNPAQASIALTTRNYTGPNLLSIINGKPTSPTSVAASSPSRMSSATKRESSEYILAPPISESSDEEGSSPVKPMPGLNLDQVFKDIGQDVPKGKVATTKEYEGGARTMRSRQPLLRDEGPQLPSLPQTKSEPSPGDDDLMGSWAQPNKRRKTVAKYGRKSSQTSDGYKPVPATSLLADRATSTMNFSMPKISPHSPQSKIRSSPNDHFIAPQTISDQTLRNKDTGPAFKMPGDIASDLTSSATTASESLQFFDLHDSPKFSPRRSTSTSSLSSVDSIASLALTQERKEALRQGEDDEGGGRNQDTTTARCPLCRSKVDQLHLETFNLGRRLNFRDQQRFCQEHKHRDAEKLRENKKYPSIDWLLLTNERIPKEIAPLGDILNRRLPSYYRDQLDAAMEEAKSRKGLQRYLTEGVVDVAKHGYYGPKGAKIMGRVITEYMSDALKQALKRDKVARAAGAGGYVNAVLVPELAVRLVMEDMVLKDQQQARDVLSESSNLGILLNADDDENLTREEEEYHEV